jgi:hypothetical protein
MPRLWYRANQFWDALLAAPASDDLEQARSILSPAESELFGRLQPSEQAHALQVFKQVRSSGETAAPLLKAALLHDVGKVRQPLQPWERAMIVLGQAMAPRLARRWGQGEARGWRRAFVVAEQHPRWGAELAQAAGVDSLTTRLIARHQDMIRGKAQSLEEQYLQRLQAADNSS